MVLCRDYQNIICVSNIWGAFKCKSFQQASRHPTITTRKQSCAVRPLQVSRLEIWKVGNWKSGISESKESQKMNILKIKGGHAFIAPVGS